MNVMFSIIIIVISCMLLVVIVIIQSPGGPRALQRGLQASAERQVAAPSQGAGTTR